MVVGRLPLPEDPGAIEHARLSVLRRFGGEVAAGYRTLETCTRGANLLEVTGAASAT